MLNLEAMFGMDVGLLWAILGNSEDIRKLLMLIGESSN